MLTLLQPHAAGARSDASRACQSRACSSRFVVLLLCPSKAVVEPAVDLAPDLRVALRLSPLGTRLCGRERPLLHRVAERCLRCMFVRELLQLRLAQQPLV